MPTNNTAEAAATARLQSLQSHLSAPTMSAPKPPITCHVLDTSAGIPASNIPVTLSRLSGGASVQSSTPPSVQKITTGVTDSDGRVGAWEDTFEIKDGEVYTLRFETWEHFGGNTFFPYVEVVFVVKTEPSKHYHVPVLLAPWSYSTYRGS